MKTILSMVISVNGMIARVDGWEDWLPHEGWEDMLNDVARYDNIIMGRETYELVMRNYHDGNFDDVTAKCKIIVTRDSRFSAPKPYVVVTTPADAIRKVQKSGLETALLIGGGELNGSFLRDNLVDELHLTVFPYILTDGRPVFGREPFESSLELLSSDRLSLGRVLNKYKVVKSEL